MQLSRGALDNAAVALGTGLVGAVVMVSVSDSRTHDSLRVAPFTLGLIATALLLLVSGTAYVVGREASRRTALVAFPGAVGAVAAGAMLDVAANDGTAVQWLSGLLTLAIAALGLYLVREVPFVVAGTLGLGAFVTRCFIQILSHLSNFHHIALWVSLVIWLFAAVATAAAWFLPGRHAVAIWIGATSLVLEVILLTAIAIIGAIASAFSDGHNGVGAHTLDVAVALACVALAAVGWIALYVVSGVPGYRVLVFVAAVAMPSQAALVLALDHPTVWELVLCILGGGALVAVLALGGGRRTEPAV